MTPDGDTSPVGQDPSRFEYNIAQGDLHLQAGKTRFRVHSYFFTRESKQWEEMLKPPVSPGDDKKRPGLYERNPIVLNEPAEDVAYFLWIFYNQDYGEYNTTLDRWIAILRLATKWDFAHVRGLAISKIDKIAMGTAEKIKLYKEYNVPHSYLSPLYTELVTRQEMLQPEEFNILDKDTLYSITQARETLRAPVVRSTGSNNNALSILSPIRTEIKEEEMVDVIARAFSMSPQEIRTFQPSVISTDTLDPQPEAQN